MFLLLNNNPLDHFGYDLLSHLVLPKDRFLLLGLPHQAPDPRFCFLGFLHKRVDVLRHSPRHSTSLGNTLLVVFEDPHHLLEVVLVGSDLVLEAID